ncbi:DNA recombination protein RmuC [Mycoplasma crocodyli]|uniref:DNA recombination protein n=1 Tax=Mycoplasma crocodyli (strain ATCC 51981 / MP145) TaxID=512564 RepID=D5E5G8_MYCCM|nr:DNA recombination protein RmuC [Mycoplasma crocodyli]ADE19937.1 DNA recombination protein [Mycoplasma crocodyli MP145]
MSTNATLIISIVLSFISLIIVITASILGVILIKKMKNNQPKEMSLVENKTEDFLRDQNAYLKANIESIKEIGKNSKEWNEHISNELKIKLSELNDAKEKIQKDSNLWRDEEVKRSDANVQKINSSLELGFEKIIKPKLENEFGNLEKNVSNLQEKIHDLQKLSSNIEELKSIFNKSFKSLGTVGEIALEKILSDSFIEGQGFYRQYDMGDRKIVDFAITIGQEEGNNNTLLPIDSKFPLEAFKDYLDIKSNPNSTQSEITNAEKYFADNIKNKAKDVASKYIIQNKTTDVALIFIPSEAIFTEIISLKGGTLTEEIRKNYKIEFISPSITNYIVSMISTWHNRFKDSMYAKEFVDLIDQFEKKYLSREKKIESIAKRAISLNNELTDLLKSDQKLFLNLHKFKNSKKRMWTSFEKDESLLQARIENSKILDDIYDEIDEAELLENNSLE